MVDDRELTPAEQSAVVRKTRGHRWAHIIRLQLAGLAPVNATPDDYDWSAVDAIDQAADG